MFLIYKKCHRVCDNKEILLAIGPIQKSFFVCSWVSSLLSKLLRKLLTFSCRVQSMPPSWSPNGLTLPSKGEPDSIPRDISSLGRSVVMVIPARDAFPLLSRDSWRGMTSSWCTLGRCCTCGGHEIFLTILGGEDCRGAWWCDSFLLKNKGLATRFTDSAETFLRDGDKESLRALPPWCVEAAFIISADLVLARLDVVFALSRREFWLELFLKRGLSSFVGGGSVTEILRRGAERPFVEDEECSDELDNCFMSGRFRAEDTFLVQALASDWLLVFPKPLSDVLGVWLLLSAMQRK